LGLRNLLVPYVAPFIARDRARRARAFRFISQLDLQYRSSSVVDEQPGLRGGPRPGERAPDGPFGSGGADTLFRYLQGPQHHLLVFGDQEIELPKAWQSLIHVDKVPNAATVLCERYGTDGSAHYLVRPDGYVEFRSPGADVRPLVAHLQKVYRPK